METIKRAGYAVIGMYGLAFDKGVELFNQVKSVDKKEIESFYGDLTKRGSDLFMKVSRTKPAKQAVEGTKQATRQIKGAATSLKKAVGLEEEKKASAKATSKAS